MGMKPDTIPTPPPAPLAVCIVTETYPPEVNGVARITTLLARTLP